MADTAAVIILAATLLMVMRPPRPWPEVSWTAPAAALVLLVGLETPRHAWDGVRPLLLTLAFLAAIFVVADVADRAGLFELAGRRLDRSGRSRGRLLASIAVVAVGITTTLSLDATAVLFTPVVIRAVRNRPDRDAPLLATILLANGASTLLPVANLTNLLAFRQLHLSFVGFAARMALPTAVSAVIITLACSVLGPRSPERADPTSAQPAEAAEPREVALHSTRCDTRLVIGGIGLLLLAFFVGSALGVDAAWIAVTGATVLGALAVLRLDARPRNLAAATAPAFLGFVICLAVVVDTARRHGLADLADRLPPGHGLLALLGVAGLAAVLANVVTNLPATLILLPAMSGRATGVVLAMRSESTSAPTSPTPDRWPRSCGAKWSGPKGSSPPSAPSTGSRRWQRPSPWSARCSPCGSPCNSYAERPFLSAASVAAPVGRRVELPLGFCPGERIPWTRSSRGRGAMPTLFAQPRRPHRCCSRRSTLPPIFGCWTSDS